MRCWNTADGAGRSSSLPRPSIGGPSAVAEVDADQQATPAQEDRQRLVGDSAGIDTAHGEGHRSMPHRRLATPTSRPSWHAPDERGLRRPAARNGRRRAAGPDRRAPRPSPRRRRPGRGRAPPRCSGRRIPDESAAATWRRASRRDSLAKCRPQKSSVGSAQLVALVEQRDHVARADVGRREPDRGRGSAGPPKRGARGPPAGTSPTARIDWSEWAWPTPAARPRRRARPPPPRPRGPRRSCERPAWSATVPGWQTSDMPKVSDEHKQAVRRRILDAARTCLERNGYHDVTTREVVAEAGLSTGTFYNYFPSKEHLYAALAEDALGADLAAALGDRGPAASTRSRPSCGSCASRCWPIPTGPPRWPACGPEPATGTAAEPVARLNHVVIATFAPLVADVHRGRLPAGRSRPRGRRRAPRHRLGRHGPPGRRRRLPVQLRPGGPGAGPDPPGRRRLPRPPLRGAECVTARASGRASLPPSGYAIWEACSPRNTDSAPDRFYRT